jgi:hypothetical protein
MNCADACLDMGYDGGHNEFYREEARKARKAYKCCECGSTIKPGDLYEYATGKNDDGFWTAYTCDVCYEIRRALVCGSWVFGQLWEEIREGVFSMWKELSPVDCLAKVDSLAARDALRAAYSEWLEEQ